MKFEQLKQRISDLYKQQIEASIMSIDEVGKAVDKLIEDAKNILLTVRAIENNTTPDGYLHSHNGQLPEKDWDDIYKILVDKDADEVNYRLSTHYGLFYRLLIKFCSPEVVAAVQEHKEKFACGEFSKLKFIPVDMPSSMRRISHEVMLQMLKGDSENAKRLLSASACFMTEAYYSNNYYYERTETEMEIEDQLQELSTIFKDMPCPIKKLKINFNKDLDVKAAERQLREMVQVEKILLSPNWSLSEFHVSGYMLAEPQKKLIEIITSADCAVQLHVSARIIGSDIETWASVAAFCEITKKQPIVFFVFLKEEDGVENEKIKRRFQYLTIKYKEGYQDFFECVENNWQECPLDVIRSVIQPDVGYTKLDASWLKFFSSPVSSPAAAVPAAMDLERSFQLLRW